MASDTTCVASCLISAEHNCLRPFERLKKRCVQHFKKRVSNASFRPTRCSEKKTLCNLFQSSFVSFSHVFATIVFFRSNTRRLWTEHSRRLCQSIRHRHSGLLSLLYDDYMAMKYVLIKIRDEMDRLNGTRLVLFGLFKCKATHCHFDHRKPYMMRLFNGYYMWMPPKQYYGSTEIKSWYIIM